MPDFLGDVFRDDNLRYFMELFPSDASSHTLCTQKALAFFFHQEAQRVCSGGESGGQVTSQSPALDVLYREGEDPAQKATQKAIADMYRLLAHTFEEPKLNGPTTALPASQYTTAAFPPPLPGVSLQTRRRLVYKLLQDTLSEIVAVETQARRPPRDNVLADALPTSRTAFLRKKWHKLRTNAQAALTAKPKKNPLCIPKQLLRRSSS